MVSISTSFDMKFYTVVKVNDTHRLFHMYRQCSFVSSNETYNQKVTIWSFFS